MFLLDDLLLAPIRGLAAVCQKVHEAAQEDLESQEKALLAALAELHQQLDAAQIGDEDFNVREGELLDRLEACQALVKGTVPFRAPREAWSRENRDSPLCEGQEDGSDGM